MRLILLANVHQATMVATVRSPTRPHWPFRPVCKIRAAMELSAYRQVKALTLVHARADIGARIVKMCTDA